MTPAILDFASKQFSSVNNFGSVLEVGSAIVNGSIRPLIQPRSKSYLGVDIVYGVGVDRVISDVSELVTENKRFDTVICCETLEHVINPWSMVDSMRTLLNAGGLLFLSSPTFGFPLHRFPIDCYRFGVDAFELGFFREMKIIAIEQVVCQKGFPIICGVAEKVKPDGDSTL